MTRTAYHPHKTAAIFRWLAGACPNTGAKATRPDIRGLRRYGVAAICLTLASVLVSGCQSDAEIRLPGAIGGVSDHLVKPDYRRLDLNYHVHPGQTTLNTPSLLLDLEFHDGIADVYTPRCLVNASGRYHLDDDGTWFFDPGELLNTRCSTSATSYGFNETLRRISQATTWEQVTGDSRMPGESFWFTSDAGTVILVPDGDQQEFDPPQPSQEFAGDESALIGTWNVAELNGLGEGPQQLLPFDWALRISAQSVELPPGCNTPESDGYVADADGRWAFGSDINLTQLMCQPATNTGQAELVFNMLRNARTWRSLGPDEIQLTGSGQTMTLTRADS